MKFEALANLAHELRTPVQVLLGYLDILRDEFAAEIAAEPRALLERMNSNVYDLAQTIDNMMEFILGEAQVQPLVEENITPQSLLAEIAPALEAANQAKHLSLRLDFDDAPEMIRAPRRPLRSILLNLGLNAVKFTQTGEVVIIVRRAPRDRSAGLEMEVSDSGPGLDQSLLEEASQPFRQLSRSSARMHRGIGLGLTIVQRNIAALGGVLELDSRPNRGTRFVVQLPLAARSGQAQLEQRPRPSTAPLLAYTPGRPVRTLQR